MLEHVARLPRIRDRAIFVGDPQDVVPTSFGPGLPDIRDWTTAHYDFAGYVTGFDPAEIADRAALRASPSGFGDEPVCVVAVGGSGVGGHLLRRAVEAYPLLRERRARHADGRRHRAADRPGVARRAARRRGARLAARPAPAARGRRRRAGAGRPDDDDGAHRRRPAVRLRAAAATTSSRTSTSGTGSSGTAPAVRAVGGGDARSGWPTSWPRWSGPTPDVAPGRDRRRRPRRGPPRRPPLGASVAG